MNFTFIIDTSYSMIQECHNNLSLLDVAKNTVEYFLKFRSRHPESKYDQLFLFTNSREPTQITLSEYRHDYLHFCYQLRNIKHSTRCDTLTTITDCLSYLNEFRILYNNDNYQGGRDPLKNDYGNIIYITDGSDIVGLNSIEKEFEKGNVRFRWDQSFHIISLNLISKADIYLQKKKIVHPFKQRIEQLCTKLNGTSIFIDNYQIIPQTIDQFVQQLRRKFTLYLEPICIRPKEMGQSAIRYLVNSNIIMPQPNIDSTNTNNNIKSQQQQQQQQQVELYKMRLLSRASTYIIAQQRALDNNNFPQNVNLISKFPFPEDPIPLKVRNPNMLLDEVQKRTSYDYLGLPKYYVDFSKQISIKFPQDFPHDKYEVESSEIMTQIEEIYSKNDTLSKINFPICYFSGFQKLFIPFGMLKTYKKEDGSLVIEVFVFANNYVEFFLIYDEITRGSQTTQVIQQRLDQFFKKVPSYYAPYFNNFFLQRKQNEYYKKWNYLMRAENSSYADLFNLGMLIQKITTEKGKFRKELDSQREQSYKQHENWKSQCCIPDKIKPKQPESVENLYLQDGNKMFTDMSSKIIQYKTKFQNYITSNILNNNNELIENQMKTKKDNLPNKLISSMANYAEILNKRKELRDPYLDESEQILVKEPLPFGNPFKLVLRNKSQRTQLNDVYSSDEAYLTSLDEPQKQVPMAKVDRKKLERKIKEENQQNLKKKRKEIENALKMGFKNYSQTLKKKHSNSSSKVLYSPSLTRQTPSTDLLEEEDTISNQDTKTEETDKDIYNPLTAIELMESVMDFNPYEEEEEEQKYENLTGKKVLQFRNIHAQNIQKKNINRALMKNLKLYQDILVIINEPETDANRISLINNLIQKEISKKINKNYKDAILNKIQDILHSFNEQSLIKNLVTE